MHPYFSVMDERWFHRAFVYTGSVTDREKNLDFRYRYEQVKGDDGQIDISWINEGLITFVKDRLGHDQRYAIDPAKITEALGWYPETKFETGIVKTIEWYLNNQDWVEEVTSGDYQKYYERMYGKK